MRRIGSDFGDDESPKEHTSVAVSVPEEFVSFSIGALNRRFGYLHAMERNGELTMIYADLPADQFASLVMEIRRHTNGVGNVTRQNQP